MVKKYTITTRPILLRDEASVKRHIAENDYFGTVATILALLKHQLTANDKKLTPQLEKSFANLEKDLKFLQDNYQIIPALMETGYKKSYNKPKTKNRNSKPKGKLINQ